MRSAFRWAIMPAVLSSFLTLSACNGTPLVPDQSPQPTYDVVVDVFRQTAIPSRDILWVIDNTLSMRDELTALAPLFDSFISSLDENEINWQVGIITADMENASGELRGIPPIITSNTANAAAVFQSNIESLMGESFSTSAERGFDAALAALSDTNLGDYGPNYGFLREGAGLTVIALSDSDEGSDITVEAFAEQLQTIAGGQMPEAVIFSAVAGPEDGCLGAQPGIRYAQAAAMLNGLFHSICQADWTQLLANLGQTQVILESSFQLSQIPVETDSMVVTIDGNTVESGVAWEYNPSNQLITFLAEHLPPVGAEIRVTYQVDLEG